MIQKRIVLDPNRFRFCYTKQHHIQSNTRGSTTKTYARFHKKKVSDKAIENQQLIDFLSYPENSTQSILPGQFPQVNSTRSNPPPPPGERKMF